MCSVIKSSRLQDLKYLGAFTIPVIALLGISLKGFWSLATPVYAFFLIPIFELIFPLDNRNLQRSEAHEKSNNKFFDWLLYLNFPIVFGIFVFANIAITQNRFQTFEFIGLLLTTGIVLGVNGINVAHELGHRQKSNERFLGKVLLLPALYMHFYIEHNFGHHSNAATKEDPATASYNQTVYWFWCTSIFRQYLSAWKIQLNLLKRKKSSFWHIKNDMLWFSFFQISSLLLIWVVFGKLGLMFSIASAIVGILLLETVNYIEHYGLLRLKTKNNRYERVAEKHSWNSNHVIGRIVLYELTRHSDHHYKSSKKYQILDCHEESPQMPFGYPTSMVLSLIPPLWFNIMNKRIPKEMISV